MLLGNKSDLPEEDGSKVVKMKDGSRLANVSFEFEPWHKISNNVVCATSKVSDQPAHTRSLIRAFACRLNIQ